MEKAVPRREEACAVCARLDWITNRFQCYLWRSSDATSKAVHISLLSEATEGPGGEDVEGEGKENEGNGLLMNGDHYCVGDPAGVNRFLCTARYGRQFPLIPDAEDDRFRPHIEPNELFYVDKHLV